MSGPLNRLAVELERPVPGVANKITNPSGAGGSVAGWLTPAGGTLVATSTTGGPYDHGIAGDKLVYRAATGASYIYTLPVAVTPGHYIAARWKAPYVAAYYTQRIEFLASDKTTVVATTLRTDTRQASPDFSPSGPQLIPATAVYARIRFDQYTNTTGGNPVGSGDLVLQSVQMVTAPTAAELGSRRVNYVSNGGAEDGAGAIPSSLGANIATTTAFPRSGLRHFRAIGNGQVMTIRSNSTSGATPQPPPIVPGLKVAFYASLSALSVPRSFRFELDVTVNGVLTTLTSPTYTDAVGSYIDCAHVFTLPALSTAISPSGSMRIVSTTTVGAEQHYIDNFAVIFGDAVPGTVFHQLTPSTPTATYEVGAASNAFGASIPFGAVEHIITAAIYDQATFWEDITGPHAEIKIARRPLDASTLSAVMKPEQLAVGLDAEVKPGAGYRVALGTEPIITAGIMTRTPKDSASGVAASQLAAADAGRILVAASKPSGVAQLSDLAWTLEDLGVAWSINGSSAQIATPATIATNVNAKAIDQIAMTRDGGSALAYAWVSRDGTIEINTAANLPAGVAATIDEDDYSYFEQGYDVDSCINIVTVKVLSTTSGVSSVTTYGPFRDQGSVDTWGEHPVTVTVQGSGYTSLGAQILAQKLLDANKTPPYQVVAVTVPIKRDDQDPIALLDLYDIARIKNTAAGTDQQLRVTDIVHEITPRKWIAKFRFSAPGMAALPQVIPEP